LRNVNPSFVRNGASYTRQFVKKFLPCFLAIAQNPSSRTAPCYGGATDVLQPKRGGCQTRSMLAVVKPSPLRLWGFLLTVLGGALIAFGAIGNWASITLGGGTVNVVPTKGIDIWQGKVALILGALIVIAILALRFVRPERRNAMAIAIVVVGLVALALGLWALLALKSVVQDTGVESLVKILEGLGIPATRARQQILETMSEQGIDVEAQAGLYMTVAGGILATVGGFVDLAWVRQKRLVGNAIDPDTLPATSEPDP
jgi:hypothetical protein